MITMLRLILSPLLFLIWVSTNLVAAQIEEGWRWRLQISIDVNGNHFDFTPVHQQMAKNERVLSGLLQNPGKNICLASITVIRANGGGLVADSFRVENNIGEIMVFRSGAKRSNVLGHGFRIGGIPQPLHNLDGNVYRLYGLNDIQPGLLPHVYRRFSSLFIPILNKKASPHLLDEVQHCNRLRNFAQVPPGPCNFLPLNVNQPIFPWLSNSNPGHVRVPHAQTYFHSEYWLMYYILNNFDNVVNNLEIEDVDDIRVIVLHVHSHTHPCPRCAQALSLFGSFLGAQYQDHLGHFNIAQNIVVGGLGDQMLNAIQAGNIRLMITVSSRRPYTAPPVESSRGHDANSIIVGILNNIIVPNPLFQEVGLGGAALHFSPHHLHSRCNVVGGDVICGHVPQGVLPNLPIIN